MGKNITKVIYKPDTQSTDEYSIIVVPEEVRRTLQFARASPTHPLPVQYEKYKAGGKLSPQPCMIFPTDHSADT